MGTSDVSITVDSESTSRVETLVMVVNEPEMDVVIRSVSVETTSKN